MTKVLIREIDVETDGLLPTDSVVEIGWCDTVLDTETLECTISETGNRLFKPRKPMAADVIGIHHITNEMVDALSHCEGSDIRQVITEGSPDFLCAHNWAMEGQYFTPTLMDSTRHICTLKAARRFIPDAPDHKLQTLRYHLGLQVDPELASPPHRAAPDAYVTAHLLAYLLQKHRVRDLVQVTLEPLHFPICPLFKHRGPWSEVPGSYLQWMATGANDLDADLKHAAQAELDQRRGARP